MLRRGRASNPSSRSATRSSSIGIRVLLPEYDVVFTDRCVINLMTPEEQLRALDQLTTKVHVGGALVVLENTRKAFEAQNDLREAVGLPRSGSRPSTTFSSTRRRS